MSQLIQSGSISGLKNSIADYKSANPRAYVARIYDYQGYINAIMELVPVGQTAPQYAVIESASPANLQAIIGNQGVDNAFVQEQINFGGYLVALLKNSSQGKKVWRGRLNAAGVIQLVYENTTGGDVTVDKPSAGKYNFTVPIALNGSNKVDGKVMEVSGDSAPGLYNISNPTGSLVCVWRKNLSAAFTDAAGDFVVTLEIFI